MNHLEASQIVFGLVLDGRKQPQAFLYDDFAEPFDKAIKYMQESPDWCKEELVKRLAPSFIQEAKNAVQSLNGMGDTTDWAKIMRDYAEDMRLGDVLERAGKNLKKGKSADYLTLSGHIQSRVLNQATGLTKGSDINCDNYNPFIPSGDETIDRIIGGIPADGPIVAYGFTGVGKSFFLARLLGKFLLHHKDKTAAIYTLEMGAEHWKHRAIKMYPFLEKVMDRLLISGSVRSIEEAIAEISAKQVNIVGFDDIDGLAKENSA